MAQLLRPQAIDQFSRILRVPESAVTQEVLHALRRLDERRELEPALQQILFDPNDTPHGPTEIADIVTSRVIAKGRRVNAALILKGKSFQRVRSIDIAHQIYKVRQLPDLGLMVLGAVGDIRDDARRDFVTGALDHDVDYLILDRLDLARLLIAYEKMCPQDGTLFREDGRCANGHQLDPGIRLELRVWEDFSYEVLKLQDISHPGAKRYSAIVLLDPHYDREVVRKLIAASTEEVKTSNYHRNDTLARLWSGKEAHVIWLYLATAPEDARHTNWLAQTQWISPDLDPRWRPFAFASDEENDGIRIKWNPRHEDLRDFHAAHRASKGEALRLLEPLLEEAISLGHKAVNLIAESSTEQLDEPDP